MLDLDDLVGIPWRDRGRTREGCDCWGLVRLAFADILGVDLPSRSEDYASAGDRAEVDALVAGGLGQFHTVEPGTEEALDFVLIRQAPWHIGLVVRRGLMLHMPEGGASVVEPYLTGRYGRRVEELYRHESRMP